MLLVYQNYPLLLQFVFIFPSCSPFINRITELPQIFSMLELIYDSNQNNPTPSKFKSRSQDLSQYSGQSQLYLQLLLLPYYRLFCHNPCLDFRSPTPEWLPTLLLKKFTLYISRPAIPRRITSVSHSYNSIIPALLKEPRIPTGLFHFYEYFFRNTVTIINIHFSYSIVSIKIRSSIQ